MTASKPSGVMRSTPSPVTTYFKVSPYIAMPSSGTPRSAGGKISPSTGALSAANALRVLESRPRRSRRRYLLESLGV